MPIIIAQHPPARDRRRHPTHARSLSTESELDEEAFAAGEGAFSASPPSIAQSPRSDVSPAPSNWTIAHEQAAQEAYELELADQYIYDLMRQFASATRALSLYDCSNCISELEKLPHVHQMSAGVLAMVGRAHYERLEYASVCSSITSKWAVVMIFMSGGTSVQSCSRYGALSVMGHGSILHTSMAPAAECAAFISGARTVKYRPPFVPSLDRRWQSLFAAKGAIASFNMFSASCPNGPNMCLRVHLERT